MTVCPIAVVAGCKKCPAFRICPLKGLLGDSPKKAAPEVDESTSTESKENTER